MSTNPYKLLRDLLPSDPLFIGTVLSNSNGVATIELPDGGVMTARGYGTVGTKVYFRGGAIEGAAPQLPIEVIAV